MEENNKMFFQAVESQDQAMQLISKLFDVAKPDTVFGKPVSDGNHTVITASEVTVGMGAGFGVGGGTGPEEIEDKDDSGEEIQPAGPPSSGFGSGGGGGGYSGARPVAAIIISPEGVRVDPIIDISKLGLAFFTMLGGIFVTGSKTRKAALGK